MPYQASRCRQVFQASVATRSPSLMPSFSSRCATFLARWRICGVIGLDDRPLDRARDDLALAVIFGGMVDDAMKQQRPVLHQAEHGIPLLGRFWTGAPRRPGIRLAPAPRGASEAFPTRRNAAICGPRLPLMRHLIAILALTGLVAVLAAASPSPSPSRCRARARRSGSSRIPSPRPSPASTSTRPRSPISRPSATQGLPAWPKPSRCRG